MKLLALHLSNVLVCHIRKTLSTLTPHLSIPPCSLLTLTSDGCPSSFPYWRLNQTSHKISHLQRAKSTSAGPTREISSLRRANSSTGA